MPLGRTRQPPAQSWLSTPSCAWSAGACCACCLVFAVDHPGGACSEAQHAHQAVRRRIRLLRDRIDCVLRNAAAQRDVSDLRCRNKRFRTHRTNLNIGAVSDSLGCSSAPGRVSAYQRYLVASSATALSLPAATLGFFPPTRRCLWTSSSSASDGSSSASSPSFSGCCAFSAPVTPVTPSRQPATAPTRASPRPHRLLSSCPPCVAAHA